jgi:hypothetical protein
VKPNNPNKEENKMDEKTRSALCEPFPAEAVKSRRGNFGKNINFVSTARVVERLNECFENNWSWEIVEHRVLDTGEVLVRGRLTVMGVVKEAFGKSNPVVSRETGEVLSQGENFKSASSDAIKLCARLLSVGAYLYADDPIEQPEEKPTAQPRTEPRKLTRPAAPRASSKQVSAIWSLGRRLGLDANAIRSRCAADYGAFPEQLDRVAASAFITALADQVDANKGAA